jgi:hypothetical protein
LEAGDHLRFALEAREPLGDAHQLAGSTLIATFLPSLVSVALYISPMPPAPSRASMREWETVVPITKPP